MRSLRCIAGIILFLMVSCGNTNIRFTNESGLVINKIDFSFNSKPIKSIANLDIQKYEFKFEPKEDGILMVRISTSDGEIHENNNLYLTASHGGSVDISFNKSKEIKFVYR